MTVGTTKKLEMAVRELRESYYQRVLADLRTSSESYAVIGCKNGVSEGVVYQLARQHGLSRNRVSVGAQDTSTDAGENSVEGGTDGAGL
jgi:hypothetical protein